MLNRTFKLRTCVPVLVLILASSAHPQTPQSGCYPDPPAVLQNEVRIAADSILKNAPDAASSRISRAIAYTVADAIGGSITTEARSLEAYRYLGETARTDKQVGASAKSGGSTTAAEKPGLINLLGFAIEHGAIQQDVSSSAVTLSTSPYAFVALVEGDTPDTYKKYDLVNRLGVSATFNVTNADNVLANVTRRQLTEWSAKVRLSGDRSTRSPAFERFWQDNVAPAIQQRLDLNVDLTQPIFADPQIRPLVQPTSPNYIIGPLIAEITAYIDKHKTDTPPQTPEQASEAIQNIIYCSLRNSVYQPIKNGGLKLAPTTQNQLSAALVGLNAAHAKLAEARIKLEKFLKHFMKQGNLSTFAYTNHRVEGSDYSELKFLFERHVNPLDVVFNAGVSLYNHPDPLKNQERVRDFSFALSLEGSSRNPLRPESEDLSRITYSFTGLFERLKENENMTTRQPNIGSAQLKLEIPIALGISVPVAYTYSATEMSMKKENKFNIGLHLDIDKLYAIARGTKQ